MKRMPSGGCLLKDESGWERAFQEGPFLERSGKEVFLDNKIRFFGRRRWIYSVRRWDFSVLRIGLLLFY